MRIMAKWQKLALAIAILARSDIVSESGKIFIKKDKFLAQEEIQT